MERSGYKVPSARISDQNYSCDLLFWRFLSAGGQSRRVPGAPEVFPSQYSFHPPPAAPSAAPQPAEVRNPQASAAAAGWEASLALRCPAAGPGGSQRAEPRAEGRGAKPAPGTGATSSERCRRLPHTRRRAEEPRLWRREPEELPGRPTRLVPVSWLHFYLSIFLLVR